MSHATNVSDTTVTFEPVPKYAIGPGVLHVDPVEVTIVKTVASATQEVWPTASVTSNPTDQLGLSNDSILGAACAAVLVLVFLSTVGFWAFKRRSVTSLQQLKMVFKTSQLFVLPFVVSLTISVATCLLAANRHWQEGLIQRWDSPDIVLRFVQGLSYIQRICATLFGWSWAADTAWLMIASFGADASRTVRLLNIAITGGNFSFVGMHHSGYAAC